MENAARLTAFSFQMWKLRSNKRATLCTKLALSPRQNFWQDWLQDWCLVLIYLHPSHDTLYWDSYSLERFASNFWENNLLQRASAMEAWALDVILFLECCTRTLEILWIFRDWKTKFDREHYLKIKFKIFLSNETFLLSFLPSTSGALSEWILRKTQQ